MKSAIKLQARKELNSLQHLDIIKLKGGLISNGYTEIIHITDKDDEFHMNCFETGIENKDEVHEFIKTFINKTDLRDIVNIFS